MMLPPDPVYIFKGEMDPVSCVAFKITPFVEHMYAGTQTGKVHVWNLKTKREVGNFKVAEDTCLSINIPEEENTIVAQNKSGGISFWKEEDHNWTLIKLIKIDFFGFCKCSIYEEIIYTSLKNSQCQMISVKEKETLKIVKLTDDRDLGEIMAFNIKLINKEKMILVAYEANRLILWNLESLVKISELGLDECPMAVDFDEKNNKGICGNPTEKVWVFSLDKEFQMKIVKTVTLTNPGVASLRIRPDGKIVAMGCWDGRLRLCSWKTLVVLAVLDTHSLTIQDVCFTDDYKDSGRFKFLLAAASQDCKISLWDLYNSS